MSDQASFSLRGRNPDVLTCIANLSNDEVFTPPEFANRMLDTLAEAWAANNSGADLWADSTVKFLDPFTKSGVFLREITSRLNKGLAAQISDLQQRIDHILTKQVFGIAITNLTSLLARRSVYCSKDANGPHSIVKGFTNDAGHVWFKRMEHTWIDGNCKFCRVSQKTFDRGEGLETHAYAFIHTDNIKSRVAQLFGGQMQFDVVIGNPPYQMKGGAGGTSDSSIYHLFVEQALRLDPRLLAIVIPSRWLAGGRGMDEFRKTMLTGKHIRHMIDYTKMSTAFPGVDFEGGVGYFVWDKDHQGDCEYTLYQAEERQPTMVRDLGRHDIFIRDHIAVGILEKVLNHGGDSIAEILTNREPFKLESNFRGFHESPRNGDVAIHFIDKGKRGIGYIARNKIAKNMDLIGKYKVLVPKAYGERGALPAMVLGRPTIASGPSVCTGSYLFFYANSEAEAQSILSYYSTKFFRLVVSLRKITQDAFRSMYSWVPQQSWDRKWTDADLYKKYKFTKDEIAFIERTIRPMNLDSADDE